MIGIVADDLTGANDIGLMYAKNGWLTKVISPYTAFDRIEDVISDTLILETNSRCDAPHIAYKKVQEATEALLQLAPTMYVKKTCSVFRGNIGAEFDAMLDTLGEDFAIVSVAFPDNGRTTIHGIHYVWDVPLAETPFNSDPAHPMTESSLLKILSSQTKREVHLLDVAIIDEGEVAMKRCIEKARALGGYLICDSRDQRDLNLIAKVCSEERCIFGSSAIGEEIPQYQPKEHYGHKLLHLPKDHRGSLILSGSTTPQSKAQAAAYRASGKSYVDIDGARLFSTDADTYKREIVKAAVKKLGENEPVLLAVLNEIEDLKKSYRAAQQAGLSQLEANIAVSRTLGDLAKAIYDQTRYNRIIVAGGESSNHVAEALGFRGNIVLEEIEPGLPYGIALFKEPVAVVFKSGSFGKPQFLLKALKALA